MVEPLVVSPSGVDAIALGDNAAFEHDGVLVQHDGIGAGEVGRSLAFVRDPRFVGAGFFAGEAPDGLTTVYGDPIPADVFVYWRDPDDPMAQEVLVGATKSAPDGTWCITGLNYNLRYVIRARASGRDDVTVVGVQPSRADVITYEGEFTNTEDFDGVAGKILITSGLSPFTATVIQPFPSGLFPVVSGRNLIIDGTTNADEVASFDVKVTSSNGAEKIIPLLQIVFGFKAPQNFASEVMLDDDVFSVALTWEVASSTQWVKIYRSETPFDMNNLPAPIAMLSGSATSYIDDAVDKGDFFYYMVVAESGAHSFASEEISAPVDFTEDEEFTWFTEVGSHKFFSGSANALEIILVAGGGGTTHKNVGGGGGGGGVVQKTIWIQPYTEYDVIVGAGGVASNGGNSSFGDEVAYGGGAGGFGGNSGNHPGGAGGSGGGGGGGWSSFRSSKGVGVVGQGHDGGAGFSGASTYQRSSGGGGGAGGPGVNASSSKGGAGGIGVQIDLITTSIWVGGGGSGATNANTRTLATLGGGGYGGTYYLAGGNGLPNTGGGAGASGENAGGALPSGGSGAVFVRRVLRTPN